jgi:RNA polymerase sigma-70 factor (ECF subfamily)
MPREQLRDDTWSELRPILDRELNNLPERYRLPLVLCDLEGMTRKEAAHQLGWAEGTVSSRLSRARVLLARRLRQHGLTLTAAAMSGIIGANAASASVPAPLVISTVKAALLTAVGQTTAARLVAGEAVALTEKVVRNMGILKLKFVAAMLLGVGVVAGLAYHGLAEQPGKQDTANTGKAADSALVRAETPREKKVEEKAAASVKEMPPVVVRTVPQAGDTKVDAAKVKEIRVTFSKDMMDKSWSWVQISKETFPKHDGEVYYDKDRRTCVMPGVKLEPGKTYVIWLNSEQYGNFKDVDGNSAVPYLLVFETKPKE